MKDLVTLKMVSGTQLIAEVQDEVPEEGTCTVINPMSVLLVPKEDKTEVNLYPYLVEISQDKTVVINVSQIEAIAGVSLEMEKYYLQLTSGIDLTTKIK